MAKMFFSAYVCIDKCADLETKLNLVQPGRIIKRRRSEFMPIQPAKRYQRLSSQTTRQENSAGPSNFENDVAPAASECKFSI